MSGLADDLDPDRFTSEEWIRYTEARTLAYTGVSLGVLLFFGGLASAEAAMSMQGADLATMKIAWGQFIGGEMLGALGVVLFVLGRAMWEAAGQYRESVERESDSR